MIRVSVIYQRKEDVKFDLNYYTNTHMPLVIKLYGDHGLLDWHVDLGISFSANTPSENIVACYMYFDTLEHVKRAFKTHGAKVMQDLTHFTNIEPQITLGQIHASSTT
jgi:uncharacterized protein (TIGR02118 family)